MKNFLSAAVEELLPRTVRLYLYVTVSLAGLLFGGWQASEGNWLVFLGGLVVSFQGVLAAGNITPPTNGE